MKALLKFQKQLHENEKKKEVAKVWLLPPPTPPQAGTRSAAAYSRVCGAPLTPTRGTKVP